MTYSRRRFGSLVRPALGAAVLGAVVWRVGFGPFRDGVQAVDGGALAAAAFLGAISTGCCAWRWTVIARRRGLPLSFGAAVAAYYRSVFLNLTLPGGVVGDVHRGLRHGRTAGGAGRALRAVAWERGIGQAVQLALTIAVLAALPSPVRDVVPAPARAAVVALLALVIIVVGYRSRRRWAVVCGLAAASMVVVAANAAMFVIAARTAGISAPATRLLPLVLLAMVATVLPSAAGWGPREGATAWAFGAAGLGTGAGVAAAVTFGVMALAASLPGALVFAGAWLADLAPAREGEAADA